MSKINLITKNNTFEKEIQKNLNNKISGEIRSDEKTRMIYSTDASIYQIVPQAVAFPKSDEDLQIIMEYAFANNIPITAKNPCINNWYFIVVVVVVDDDLLFNSDISKFISLYIFCDATYAFYDSQHYLNSIAPWLLDILT